ncbi:hypothetical protein HDU79_002250 [Rhizoclosmatium sp. JEL0117]|nr:hypothetical protein HDU79_002250 [Rhizoclosmatium sp. JEL0117]
MTSMQTGFFIAGLLYFPLASLAVAAVYENTYFLVAEVFEKYDHESNRRTSRVLMEESIKVQKVQDDDSWAFLPLGIPITNSVESGDYLNVSEPYGILFLVGLSYFPLVSLAICAIYENTYFLIADLYDDPDSRWFEDDRRLNKRTQLHRGVLLRCIIMSIFQLALYAPSIVMIFLSIWKADIFDLSVKAAWLQFTAAVLPAADPLTTVIVILMFTNDFRAAFFSDCKLLWDVVSGRRKQSDQQSDVTLQAI